MWYLYSLFYNKHIGLFTTLFRPDLLLIRFSGRREKKDERYFQLYLLNLSKCVFLNIKVILLRKMLTARFSFSSDKYRNHLDVTQYYNNTRNEDDVCERANERSRPYYEWRVTRITSQQQTVSASKGHDGRRTALHWRLTRDVRYKRRTRACTHRGLLGIQIREYINSRGDTDASRVC